MLCFRGTYNADYKGENINACLPCKAGYYCPSDGTTEMIVCGKGWFSDTGASVCTLCKEGRYCDYNATSFQVMWYDKICPAGLECPEGMNRMPDAVSDKCRVGHYCPKGDVSPCPLPCPNGTFNEHYGLQQVSECQKCTAGMFCVPEGLSQPAGPCPGGYYCPKGTGEPTSFPCPVGFYRNGSARESFQDCTECVSGYYCDEEGLDVPKDCPRGFFCVSGSTFPQPCPLGTYGNSTTLRRSTDCTPCPGGYYCDGIGRTEPTDVCDAGFYCREKAFTSAPPDGPTGGVCPKGGYCPPGTAFPLSCDPGMYSASPGAKTKYDCVPCDPGNYCPGSSSSDSRLKCAAGFYCTGGSSVPNQFDVEKGHYSHEGAFKQEPCPRGTYQNAVRSKDCLDCPQGYYCNGTGTVDPVICPPGHYCPKKSEGPTPCPRGRFLKEVGLYAEDHCNLCTAGYACEIMGLVEPVTKCAAGYYCLEGSNTTHPVEMSFGDACPPGYYCLEGTADFLTSPCANGTYSNATGNTEPADCTSCDPGRVCSGVALTEPNKVCAPGYFCRGGASTDMPIDGGATGDPCTKGHYCPAGTGRSILMNSLLK